MGAQILGNKSGIVCVIVLDGTERPADDAVAEGTDVEGSLDAVRIDGIRGIQILNNHVGDINVGEILVATRGINVSQGYVRPEIHRQLLVGIIELLIGVNIAEDVGNRLAGSGSDTRDQTVCGGDEAENVGRENLLGCAQ